MRAIVVSIVLIATAVSAQSASAQSNRDYWILGTINDASGSPASVTMIDVARITTSGGIKSAYVETFYPPQREDGRRRLAALVEVDCTARRMRTLVISAFSQGSSSPTTAPGDGAWASIRPNTAGEATLSFVCSSNQQREANPVLFHLGPHEPEGAADLLFRR